MAKIINNSNGSIEKGSNQIVCESNFQPHSITVGSDIKFNGDPESYQISKIDDLYFVVDFEMIKPDGLIIKESESKNIVLGDMVDISFKEYQINRNIEIIFPGKGYEVGDKFSIDEGTAQKDSTTEESFFAELEVSSVNGQGGVKELKINKNGNYTKVPEGELLLAWIPKGGSGEDLEINIYFSPDSKRSVFRKEVISLSGLDAGTFYLELDSPIPEEIKIGKISSKKKVITISIPYLSETKHSQIFGIVQDFTGNCRLPLMLENSLNAAFIFNKAMKLADQEITLLKDRISKLESSLGKKDN
jgi:translation initiation factor IF-1|tara:strand:+ start:169 stop:1077 length:909 start_codon:yes stop_codon:yes gene_type:complete